MGSEIGSEVIPRDQRGRHVPANKLDLQPVIDHIESFNPTVSHYRREPLSTIVATYLVTFQLGSCMLTSLKRAIDARMKHTEKR